MKRLQIVVLMCALACGAPALAQSETYSNRTEALKGLSATDAARRADAVIWIAANGVPADEEALRKRLTDDNPIVRGLAEQGVWMLWSRSGDEKIDAMMAKGA